MIRTTHSNLRGSSVLAVALFGGVLGCSGDDETTTTSQTTGATSGVTSASGSGGAGSGGAGATSTSSAGGDASSSTGSGGSLTPDARCQAVKDSVVAAGFDAKVKVTCDATYAYVESDTYPEHPKMTGIKGTNDQVPVPAPGYRSPVALAPKLAAKPTSIDAALGVAVNGVPIYDYSSQGGLSLDQYDPKFDTKLQGELDQCNGHAGRGDDYHYHAAPICMMEAMKKQGPDAILGWAFDGFPIYANANPDGSAIAAGTLDVCNGQKDPTFGFRYHTSDTHPYILQCLSGEFDLGAAPKVPPLDKQGGGGKPPGEKPPSGVQNLTLTENPNGQRTMTYDYAGKTYSIAYKPGAQAGCWDFTEQSYTTKGIAVNATYCRKPF